MIIDLEINKAVLALNFQAGAHCIAGVLKDKVRVTKTRQKQEVRVKTLKEIMQPAVAAGPPVERELNVFSV